MKTRSRKDERSRSSKRLDPQPVQEVEVSQTDVTSTAEDHALRGGLQPAPTDKPKRTRPRFDPSLEHELLERLLRDRKGEGQLEPERRDPSTEGVPSPTDEEERRKRVPLPPPGNTTSQ